MSPVPARRTEELDAARRRIEELEERLAAAETSTLESREREARFRILSELVADACWARWSSADGNEVRAWVNDAFEDLTGYTPAEFEQIGRDGLVHPDDLEAVQQYIDGPVGVSQHEFRIVRKDGSVRWLSERMQVVERPDGGLSVFGATRDVTDEKRAREVLLNAQRDLERSIEERTRELVRVNEQLQHEIDERRQMAAELRRAKDEAEASSLAKSRFLATITHELRTPLHGIVGFVDLLLDVDVDGTVRQYLEMLERSATSLQALVEEVLDFSKIEADQLVLDVHPFVLGSLVDELVESLAERAAERGNRIEVQFDPALPTLVEGDSVRLRQILLNLLDNAVKFTRDGVVLLEVEPATAGGGRSVRFRVSDTGIGFDETFKRQMFDPFSQADASTTRLYGGTGLGLAISRRLVELMGGGLDAESEPGEGSVFTFEISLPSANRASRGGVDRPSAVEGAGRKILVAEDNTVNQLVIRELLESRGYLVDVACDGEEALEALSATRYDLCLLDCAMPRLDGLEVARRWRARETADRRLPILAVTATAVREQIEACYVAGMDDVLTKPFRHASLAEAVERWIG